MQSRNVEEPDVFGVEDRLQAIRVALEGKPPFATAVDLGGHSGFFSLSLVDLGIAQRSTVYDLDVGALDAGRSMAADMNLSGRVEYREQGISLDFIRSLPPTELIICLNLIHHAGARFDVEDVKQRGWEAYAGECLTHFRAKSRVAIVGLGFKSSRPLYWDVAKPHRPLRFYDMATRAGWSVSYDANVEDIQSYGVTEANGRRTRRQSFPLLRSVAKKLAGKMHTSPKEFSKASNYHIFILE